ncbi:RNA 3'-terminal phosphate cyclase isoform X2 [Nematostella vectensis]|uniref:RNA 3'-terminal phosphate cyclase isoform X2 n=1 Tax=Nematostella vectensis TaxID=45351 RepID=UPI00207716FB|nr:RNA 3'-terminal phosphate cyclase isoform X2 [Nematostella vectensis]
MDFFDKVYRPIVEKFGFHFSIEIKRRSYFPQSSGKVVIRSFPVTNLKAVDLTTPGRLVKITGWTSVAGAKPIRIAQVMSKLTRSALKDRFPGVDIYVESLRERDSRVDGTGQAVMILGETSSGMMLSGTALWRRGMSHEEVVQKAVNMFTQNSSHSICVDSLVQDKLLPYMALAKGQSSIRTSLITPHTKAAIAGLEAMSKVKFQVTSDVIGGSKTMVISCNGLGITR